MLRMYRSEWMKIRRSFVWLLLLVSPLVAALLGLLESDREGEFPWLIALSMMAALHAMLFLPLLTGVYAALVCRYEHIGGGWKQLLALPVTRTQVYFVKFALIMGMVALTQLLFLGVLLLVGAALGFSEPPPWQTLLASVAGGWIATLPLAALQLAVSTAWPSFAAPLAVNVVMTLPNVLIVYSEDYGPYYPWAQPLLAMLPRGMGPNEFGAFGLSAVTLFVVILGSFAVFFAGGWLYFTRKAV